ELLELPVEILKHWTMLPRFEAVTNERTAELRKRPHVAKVDDLLQGQIGHGSAPTITVVQYEVGYGPPIICHGTSRSFYVLVISAGSSSPRGLTQVPYLFHAIFRAEDRSGGRPCRTRHFWRQEYDPV